VRLGLAEEGLRTFVMHGLRKTAASDVDSLGVGAAGIWSAVGARMMKPTTTPRTPTSAASTRWWLDSGMRTCGAPGGGRPACHGCEGAAGGHPCGQIDELGKVGNQVGNRQFRQRNQCPA
jgi:hypothetical protein